MRFEVLYHDKVVSEDIPKLDKASKERVKRDIESKLTARPEVFGRPLRKSLKGYRKLRSGDYRVVFRIDGEIIRILTIEHRSIVYEKGMERLKNDK